MPEVQELIGRVDVGKRVIELRIYLMPPELTTNFTVLGVELCTVLYMTYNCGGIWYISNVSDILTVFNCIREVLYIVFNDRSHVFPNTALNVSHEFVCKLYGIADEFKNTVDEYTID